LGVLAHIDWLREVCLSLPHATEDIQWENNLLFRVARKMFCVASLEPEARVRLSLKCTPEKFAELVEIEGIIPAPYMARNHWVGFLDLNALRRSEIQDLILSSYRLVFEKLPKRVQAELLQPGKRQSSGRTKQAARQKKSR
jgi:predicted DNA-binding protein (MmcQ/YjbR family)